MTSKFSNFTILSILLVSCDSPQKMPSPTMTLPTPSAKRMRYKQPLPPQPQSDDILRANGLILVDLTVSKAGKVDQVKLIQGRELVFQTYRKFLMNLEFQPTASGDVGPWVVTMNLSSESSGVSGNMRAKMNIKIVQISGTSGKP